MEKISIRLSKFNFKSLKKTIFIFKDVLNPSVQTFFLKGVNKKFSQTRYQQSKERFGFFNYKTSMSFEVPSGRKNFRKFLQKILLNNDKGFKIKQ